MSAIIEVSDAEKNAEAIIRIKSIKLSQKVDSDSNQSPKIVNEDCILTLNQLNGLKQAGMPIIVYYQKH